MRTQCICRAWGHFFARGFARFILDRLRDNLDPARGSYNWGASWALTLSSTSSTRPRLEKAVLNGLYPNAPRIPPYFFRARLPINQVFFLRFFCSLHDEKLAVLDGLFP
jgi:hypothetical protein